MVYPREVLNKLKWAHDESLEDVTIWYVHRGAPGNVMSVSGKHVRSLGKGFFETEDATIPYHRIVRIEHDNALIWRKPARRPTPHVTKRKASGRNRTC